MKPYKLITGNNENIAAFEHAISASLEEGYEFANGLITKVITTADGANKVLFFQPMIFEEILEDIYEEDEDDEEYEEDDDELI